MAQRSFSWKAVLYRDESFKRVIKIGCDICDKKHIQGTER